ncbi:hypothetical protein [Pseudomonas guariconensis]|uniref:hypothetical protein n=1 Tax=Pseudomonas guariconensis TaxID=1288410 RepID=UPI0018AA19F8|nr:hypothetical protein [Pseudomonas guariconensis]MBF8754561.1 hypothetical protein [Pseudomonas guariconensis]
MNRKPLCFVLSLMALAPPFAQAERMFQTSSGCTVILTLGAGVPPDSAEWSGDCIDGKVSGNGSLVASWGSEHLEYRGEMRDGMFNGQGVYRTLQGQVFNEEFKNGVPLRFLNGANTSAVEVVAIYNCVIPSLSDSVGRELSVLKSKSGPVRYYVVSENDRELLFKAKSFGAPNKGDFSLTLSSGARITIASNGWATTNRDRVHNKNSLYGEVSGEQNSAAGQCEYLQSGEIHRYTRVE